MDSDTQTQVDAMRENGATVSIGSVDWSTYATDGALVALHIGRWRAETKLSISDLGIEPESDQVRAAIERVMNLGTILLLPRRVLKRFGKLHDGARHALEVESLKTDWGRFVPRRNYAAWSERNRRIRDAYVGFAQEVSERWEDYKAEMVADFETIARNAYATASRAGAVGDQTEDAFTEAFVAAMLRKMPSAEGFVQTIMFRWDTRYVPLKGQDVLSEAARDALESDIRETTAREAAEGLARFVESIQTDIRSRVLEACEGALAALKGEERNNGKVAKTGVRGLKAMVERVSALKFWDEPGLDAQLAQIASLCDAPKGQRQDATLETLLTQVAGESALILESLPRETRRVAKVFEVQDTEDMVKVARRAPKAAILEEDDESEPVALKRGTRKGKASLVA